MHNQNLLYIAYDDEFNYTEGKKEKVSEKYCAKICIKLL